MFVFIRHCFNINVGALIQSPFQPLKIDNITTKSTGELIEGFGASLFVLPIIMFIEQMSIAKAFGRKFNYKVKAQQELIAIGMCNIVASFYGGWTVGGSFTRSAVNSISGAQTPLAGKLTTLTFVFLLLMFFPLQSLMGLIFFCYLQGLISGAIALIALQLLTPAFYYIPSSALGAMMLMAVLPMIEIGMLKNIWKLRKWDLIPFLATFWVSFYKLEYGVLVGTGISLITMISRQLRPKYLLDKNYQNKSITLLMLENLTYPGLEAMNKIIYSEIKNFEGVERLFLDMSTMIRVDFTILKNFEHLQTELSKKEITLHFVNFSRESVRNIFSNAGLLIADKDIGQTIFLSTWI